MFDIFNVDSNWLFLLIGLAFGFTAIIFGGDWFVDSAIWLAEVTRIPKMIIGATIVSIGTTLPETLVSFLAAGAGQTGLAIGNSIGSIFCNTALILAITMTASVAKNMDLKQFLPKMAMLLVVTTLITIFSSNRSMVAWESVVLVLMCAVFLGINVYDAIVANKNNKKLGVAPNNAEAKAKNPIKMISLFFVGAALIALGANVMIDSVSAIASKIGMSEQIISLTVVALGTSLPELVTAINSLKKSNTEISMGNILGANILNASLIVGGSGLIAGGLTLPDADYLSFIVTVALIFFVLIVVTLPILFKKRTYRWQGIVMLATYVGYLVFLILNSVGIIQ